MGIWSKVLILAAWALAAFVGQDKWPIWIHIVTGVVAMLSLGYLIYREQKGFAIEFVRGNLLYILPFQMIWVLALSITDTTRFELWWVWTIIMLGSVVFDAVAHSGQSFDRRKQMLMVLYSVIWTAIFIIIHQLVLLGGRLDASGMVVFTVLLSLSGLAYVGLALYRFIKLEPLNK